MENHTLKLAGALRVMQDLYREGKIKGVNELARSIREDEIIHEIRKNKGLSEEEAIDIADELNILNVIPARDDGQFVFNEQFLDLSLEEIIHLHKAQEKSDEDDD